MPTYQPETLDENDDNGTMPENKAELEAALVGHRIVAAGKQDITRKHLWGTEYTVRDAMVLTLDNGHRVILQDGGDCCAFTEVESFLLHPERVDHAILGVGTTDQYQTWHIYADLGDVLELKVGWSPGNPFYYAYGFNITVEPIPEEEN